MGVLLQGFYKREPNNAVPSPADGGRTTPWWWDHLTSQAKALRLVGFTAVWLPPVLMVVYTGYTADRSHEGCIACTT